MLLRSDARRRGASAVENAIVLTVLLLLLLGILVIGLGVFRYQQVATLAREGARYASVRGSQYEKENPGVTPNPCLSADVKTFLEGKSVGLDLSALDVQVFLVTPGGEVPWDGNHEVYTTTATGRKRNSVRVTVNYNWRPEAAGFLNIASGINLTSTSVMPMSY